MKRAAICLATLVAACNPTKPAETPVAAASELTPVEPAAAAALQPATVDDIKLVRGFYVQSDTPCEEASNATLYLLRRTGLGESHTVCTFEKIEAESDLRFHVTQRCDDGSEPSNVIIEMKSLRDFDLIYEGGSTSKFHQCPQTELPEPWRNNDISDLITE
jgi:hypothetical protein